MLIIIGLFLSSHHLFQVYYKVRQHILLQSPGWSVITKCDSFFIIKCDNFIAKCDRYYKVQQNIPQAKISRIPEYGVQSLHGANIWTYTFHGSWMWKTTTITKTKQTSKNQTKQNKSRTYLHTRRNNRWLVIRQSRLQNSSAHDCEGKSQKRKYWGREKSCSRDVIQGYSFDQSFTKAGKLKLIEGIRFY